MYVFCQKSYEKNTFLKRISKALIQFNCIFRKQLRLAVAITFFKMLKYLFLNFPLHKYSKAILNYFLYKSKTITFIKTDSYDIGNKNLHACHDSTNKRFCKLIKHFQVYFKSQKQV